MDALETQGRGGSSGIVRSGPAIQLMARLSRYDESVPLLPTTHPHSSQLPVEYNDAKIMSICRHVGSSDSRAGHLVKVLAGTECVVVVEPSHGPQLPVEHGETMASTAIQHGASATHAPASTSRE